MLLCLVTFALYWAFPRTRLWVLALANALFYLVAGWQNLGLFLGASLATYWLGGRVTGPRGRAVMWLGIVLNLANLCLFKYAGFVSGSLHPFLPWFDPRWVQAILLPIGISFYTFQHISYLVDRRLKSLAPAPNYLHFWVYISFFGHSIAGPIMRGHEFFPQIAEASRKVLDGNELRYGVALFTLGLFKKVVIADHLAPQVDVFFKDPSGLMFAEAWVAALLFAFQIYYDFSAYSDMAVGIGHMFGYRLNVNFKTPYLAANASEFWSRWHITLSSWIRDYVYIPLGGNRVVVPRQLLNVFLAMLASGLWHGAAWTFVFWGAYHGLLLLGQRGVERVRRSLGWALFQGRAYRVFAIACFFALTVVGWVFFRAPGLEEAWIMLGAMFDVRQIGTLLAVKSFLLLLAGLYALHLLEFLARQHGAPWARAWVERVPVFVQGVAYASLTLVIMGSYQRAKDFIYFQF